MTVGYLIALVTAAVAFGVFVGWLCRDLIAVRETVDGALHRGEPLDLTTAAARGELFVDLQWHFPPPPPPSGEDA